MNTAAVLAAIALLLLLPLAVAALRQPTLVTMALSNIKRRRAATLDVFDVWFDQRRRQRALPHPRDGRLADFVFVERGRHLGPTRLQTGLRDAVVAAGLTGPDATPLHIVSHQLRHTYATSLEIGGVASGATQRKMCDRRSGPIWGVLRIGLVSRHATPHADNPSSAAVSRRPVAADGAS